MQTNITEIFNRSSDGFRSIFEDDSPLYISSVVQQAEIMVTETGTEAAAATSEKSSIMNNITGFPEN